MATQGYAVGNPMPAARVIRFAALWLCDRSRSLRGRLSARRMSWYAVAGVAGNLHPDHDTLAAFRRTFLPELRDLFGAAYSCSRHLAGVLKLGTISLDGTRAPCGCFQTQSGELQATSGVGSAGAIRSRGTFCPKLTERAAGSARWIGGARGDCTTGRSSDTAGRGQSGTASSCPGARDNRAGGL